MSREHDDDLTTKKDEETLDARRIYPVELGVPYRWLRSDINCDSDSEQFRLKVFSTQEDAEKCQGEIEFLPELCGSKDVFMLLNQPQRSQHSPKYAGIVNVIGMNKPCFGWMCFSLDCVEFERVTQDQ